MNEKEALENLKQIKEIFDKHNMEFWLDYGTLLGAVRDGKFIPWDSDIDLSMWKKNKEKLPFVLRDLNFKDFSIYCGEFVIAFRKNNILISLDMYDLVGGKAVRCARLAKNFVGKTARYLKWVISAWNYNSVYEDANIITKVLHKISFMIHNTSLKDIIFGSK